MPSFSLTKLVLQQATPLPHLSDYHRIQCVSSFDELISTPFHDGINALCWQRSLPGDFEEVARSLNVGAGINTIDEARLLNLSLSKAGQVARDVLLEDQRLLRAHDLAPVLDCINGYTHELESDPVPTHVQSFHADSATAAADTFLCTYLGATSEGLPNEEAINCTLIPETRAALLKLYGGNEDAGFEEFLTENYYDLHYRPLPHAKPYSFGLFNLWRIAIQYPDCPVPPCIHRAPDSVPGQLRLLLIS